MKLELKKKIWRGLDSRCEEKIPKEVKIHCLSQDRHISCIVGAQYAAYESKMP